MIPYFTKEGCFDIEDIQTIIYNENIRKYEVSFKYSSKQFFLTKEQYNCFRNDMIDQFEFVLWCDNEFDEDGNPIEDEETYNESSDCLNEDEYNKETDKDYKIHW